MSEPATQPLEALVVRSDEGEARWWIGSLAVIRATADDTGGHERAAERRTLPPPSDEEPDWEHVAAVAKASGCELLASADLLPTPHRRQARSLTGHYEIRKEVNHVRSSCAPHQ